MRSLGHIFISLAVLLSFSVSVPARERYLGTFHSPKGFGAGLLVGSEEGSEINLFSLYADMFGVFSGRTKDVGIALCYSRDYVISSFDLEFSSVTLHGGPGFMTGYLHDYERSFFSHDTDRNMGFVAALSGNIGLLTDFYSHRISIDLGFCVNPGIHVRRDSDDGAVLISMYKRGIYFCLYPQLCIYYRF